jgi:hypothetical protein
LSSCTESSLIDDLQEKDARLVSSLGVPPSTAPVTARTGQRAPVVTYTIRYKESDFGSCWKHMTLKEQEYDEYRMGGSFPVFEILSDCSVNEDPVPGKQLKISGLLDEKMIVYSPLLIDLLPTVLGYYPNTQSCGCRMGACRRSLTLYRPYQVLGSAIPKIQEQRMKYQKEIEEGICNAVNDPEDFQNKSALIEHIKCLEHELDKVLKEAVSHEKKGYKQDQPVASFPMLWLLFEIGSSVLTDINDNPSCCVVRRLCWKSLPDVEQQGGIKEVLEIHMWFLDYNG